MQLVFVLSVHLSHFGHVDWQLLQMAILPNASNITVSNCSFCKNRFLVNEMNMNTMYIFLKILFLKSHFILLNATFLYIQTPCIPYEM